METNATTSEKAKEASYKSCFEVIGPIMVGPSSSHTAGALSIGLIAHQLFKGVPKKVVVKYYESFAETHKGHGTDFAIIGGVLGFATDDSRVPDALKISESKGIDITFIEEPGESPAGHPNTAEIYLGDDNRSARVVGISVGGGLIKVKHIEVEGFQLDPGEMPVVLAITKEDNFEIELRRIFKAYEVRINDFNEFYKEGKYLYQFNLNSQLTHDAHEELVSLGDMVNIIVLN